MNKKEISPQKVNIKKQSMGIFFGQPVFTE
jgi:hypothetical protein